MAEYRLLLDLVAVRGMAPQHTRLKPYSPEVIAILPLALAAGRWLAKLAG